VQTMPDGSSKRAIIIGSGLGGSAIGALLSHRGYQVMLFEKLPYTGGPYGSRDREGFTLDRGLPAFPQSAAGPLGEVLRQCGLSYEAIQWSAIKHSSQKLNYLGKTVEYPEGIGDLGVSIPEHRAIMTAIAGITPEEIEELDLVSLSSWLKRFTRDQVFFNLFVYFSMLYFLVPPKLASAGDFIRAMRGQILKKKSGYPVGGYSVLSQSYVDIICANGGVILTNEVVKRIIIENNRATGVEMATGEILKSDLVISDVDPVLTIQNLGGGVENFPLDYIQEVMSLNHSLGFFHERLALKECITTEKFVIFIGHPDAEEYYERIENDEIPDMTSLRITIISNLDPTVAPPGKQLIVAGTCPVKNPDWHTWDEAVMRSLKQVFPKIEKQILFKEVNLPIDVNRPVGEGGGTIRLDNTAAQVREKGISQRTPVRNLYLVGAEAGGRGMDPELSANSALELNTVIP
jgi:phytoene dehydrogenase-like protein